MKKQVPNSLRYPQCSEDAKRLIKDIFSWRLRNYPYPCSLDEQIVWIYNMDEALRGIEEMSVTVAVLDRKKQNCRPCLRLVR